MTAEAPEVAGLAAGQRKRIMLDAVNWRAIVTALATNPALATMAMGYLDGPLSMWPAQAWAILGRHTGLTLVTCTVAGHPQADVADIEHGDLSDGAGAAWALRRRSDHQWPVLYCNRSSKPGLLESLARVGLDPGPDGAGLLVATLDGTFTDLDGRDLRTEPGVVGVQAWGATGANDYDTSQICDPGWLAERHPGWEPVALQHAAYTAQRATEAMWAARHLTELISQNVTGP